MNIALGTYYAWSVFVPALEREFGWNRSQTSLVSTINMVMVRTVGFAFLYIPPVLFGQLLRFIDDYSSAVREGITPPALKIGLMIAGAMFFFNVASTTTLCIAFHANTDLGIEARAATVALIYRKALRLSPAARVKSTLGEISRF